jgi:hypothetical protein
MGILCAGIFSLIVCAECAGQSVYLWRRRERRAAACALIPAALALSGPLILCIR